MAENTQGYYEVTTAGTYYAGTKNNKISRSYSGLKFNVPNLATALHTIQRKLLDERMRRDPVAFEGYASWRECHITDTKFIAGTMAGASPKDLAVADMNSAQLKQFVIEQCLDVNPEKFGTVAEARRAVSDAFDDKTLLERVRREQAAADAADALAKAQLGQTGVEAGSSDAAPIDGLSDVLEDGPSGEPDPMEGM